MPIVREQLSKALQYEQILFNLYEEMAGKFAYTKFGLTCLEMAVKTEEKISQLNRWLQCSG